jgi:hypothetical protein
MGKKEILSGFPVLILVILLGAVGCSPGSHVIIPNDVPKLNEYKYVRISGTRICLSCIETDNIDFLIYSSVRHGSFYGNKKLWCEKLVSALSQELESRGAIIDSSAEKKFDFMIPEITGRSGHSTVGFNIKAIVSSSASWRKSYEGKAGGYHGFIGVGTGARAANYAISELIKAMLADDVFVSQIAGNGK